MTKKMMKKNVFDYYKLDQNIKSRTGYFTIKKYLKPCCVQIILKPSSLMN